MKTTKRQLAVFFAIGVACAALVSIFPLSTGLLLCALVGASVGLLLRLNPGLNKWWSSS